MKTISSVVEQYIKSKPFLLSSLSQGIINLTSLARIMMPELEAHLGKDVKQGAVVMSLKRLSEELDFKINYKISKVLKNIGEITVRSSLTDFTYVISDTLLENISIFKNEKLTHKIENLSSITVKLPQENISTPGIYYYIFQKLAWEGIIIHEVISTTNEFTIIVSDDQIDVAFKVIKDLKNVFD